MKSVPVRSRTPLIIALLLLAAALGLYATLRLTYGDRAAYVHIRWAANLDAASRQDVEKAHSLSPVELRGERTWLYLLADVSTSNIRTLINNPAVEDTHYLDRIEYDVSSDARRGDYRTSRPVWIARLTEAVVRGLVVLAAIALVVALVRAQPPVVVTTATPERQRQYAWVVAALATALPLLVALCATMWRAPFPISETVALLDDAGVLDDTPVSLDSPTLRSFFDPTVRPWYRPFYHLTWYSFWHLTGSLNDSLALFRLVEVGAVALLVLLFVWHLRPGTFTEYAAASFAVAVLTGMPALRENLEIPMLYTLVGIPMILIAWMLLERAPRPWHGVALVALLIAASGFKEQGLIIAALVVTAWWFGAPGARRGVAASVSVVTVIYVAFRLSTSGTWAPFEQDVSLGFTNIPAADASQRFGDFPLPMYAYNAGATVLNVLFSEPTSGRFVITESLVRDDAAPWQLNHLVSSIALTALIGWWGIRTWRANAGQPWSVESRVFAAVIVTVAASGPLGFNYTRDRLGGMATPFYAMAAFYAMRSACERATRVSGARMIAACAALLLLAGAWQLRAIGTIDAEHVRAAKVRREWMVDLHQERVEKFDKPRYLRILEMMAGQGMEPAAARPTPYPSWAARWLGER